MAKSTSYRDSHKAGDKGTQYDRFYQEDVWSRFLWSQEQHALDQILRNHFQNRDVHLLDYACGTGRITNFLEDKTDTSVGVDVSPSMLAQAREKLNRTELIQADLTADNVLRGRKFNLITSFRFFLNAEADLRLDVIKILASLLSADGVLVFNNHQNICAPFVRAASTWSRIRSVSGYNTMSIRQMKSLARSAGLHVVDLLPVGYFHIPRVNIPETWCRRFENVARILRVPARWSESPIAICCHPRASSVRDESFGGR